MPEKSAELVLSPTSLKSYMSCPRAYFYNRRPEIPKKTDYPRLCGGEVHRLIPQLYKPTKDERPFYFKEKKTLLGAWISRWDRALEKESAKLVLPNELDQERYKLVGLSCLSQYWDANFGKQHPLETEKRYKYTLRTGISLLGIMDQVREVPLSWIVTHRPELIIDGKLSDNYLPHAIVDLKTDYLGYDLKAFKENPSLEEEIRNQYKLHEELQATAYSFLYEKRHGKKPIGFLWYHLRSGKTFFTYRDDKDYADLLGVIEHVIDNLQHQSFPKHVDNQCKRCDYEAPCREDRNFLIAKPEDLSWQNERLQQEPTNVIKTVGRQSRMKLNVPRQKREQPVIVALAESKITRLPAYLPWEED